MSETVTEPTILVEIENERGLYCIIAYPTAEDRNNALSTLRKMNTVLYGDALYSFVFEDVRGPAMGYQLPASCIDMYCTNVAQEHRYGHPKCRWAWVRVPDEDPQRAAQGLAPFQAVHKEDIQ